MYSLLADDLIQELSSALCVNLEVIQNKNLKAWTSAPAKRVEEVWKGFVWQFAWVTPLNNIPRRFSIRLSSVVERLGYVLNC